MSQKRPSRLWSRRWVKCTARARSAVDSVSTGACCWRSSWNPQGTSTTLPGWQARKRGNLTHTVSRRAQHKQKSPWTQRAPPLQLCARQRHRLPRMGRGPDSRVIHKYSTPRDSRGTKRTATQPEWTVPLESDGAKQPQTLTSYHAKKPNWSLWRSEEFCRRPRVTPPTAAERWTHCHSCLCRELLSRFEQTITAMAQHKDSRVNFALYWGKRVCCRVPAGVFRALDWSGEVRGWLLTVEQCDSRLLIGERVVLEMCACSNYRVSLIQDVTRYYYFHEKCDWEDSHMTFIFYLFIDQEWFLVVLGVWFILYSSKVLPGLSSHCTDLDFVVFLLENPY